MRIGGMMEGQTESIQLRHEEEHSKRSTRRGALEEESFRIIWSSCGAWRHRPDVQMRLMKGNVMFYQHDQDDGCVNDIIVI